MTRPHRGHSLLPHPFVPAQAHPARPAAGDRELRAFRHRAAVFSLLDHEAAPTAIAVLAAGAAVLVGLTAIDGHVLHTDGARPTVLAWLALLCLAAAMVAAAGQILAWLLARPLGWDLARTAAALEEARATHRRLAPMPPPEDAALQSAAHRVDLAIDHLAGRLDDAEAAMTAFTALPDPDTRASRLALVRDEAHRLAQAAEAVDGTRHLLLWIEACPWSAAREEALARLRLDLDAAERLIGSTT